MIEKIEKKELSKYRQLFCEIFSEEPSFAKMMFAEKLDTVCTLRENGEPVSFLYPIPFSAKVNDKLYRAMYIYGVGTVKEARGKGYMKEVFRRMEAYYGNSVDFYYLVPASPSLFSLYETIGYKTAFYLDKRMLFPEKNPQLQYEVKEMPEAFHTDYLAYATTLSTVILRKEEDNRLILKECKYFRINQSGFLLAHDSDTAMVRESFVKQEADLDCFCDFLARKGYQKAIFTHNGNKTPYAMVKSVNPSLWVSDFYGGYTNLNFD